MDDRRVRRPRSRRAFQSSEMRIDAGRRFLPRRGRRAGDKQGHGWRGGHERRGAKAAGWSSGTPLVGFRIRAAGAWGKACNHDVALCVGCQTADGAHSKHSDDFPAGTRMRVRVRVRRLFSASAERARQRAQARGQAWSECSTANRGRPTREDERHSATGVKTSAAELSASMLQPRRGNGT